MNIYLRLFFIKCCYKDDVFVSQMSRMLIIQYSNLTQELSKKHMHINIAEAIMFCLYLLYLDAIDIFTERKLLVPSQYRSVLLIDMARVGRCFGSISSILLGCKWFGSILGNFGILGMISEVE